MRKLFTLLLGVGAGIAIAVYFSAREEFEVADEPGPPPPPAE